MAVPGLSTVKGLPWWALLLVGIGLSMFVLPRLGLPGGR